MAGASGAIVGAYGGYHARKAVVQTSGIPDPIVALIEDALAIGAGAWAAHRLPLNALGSDPKTESYLSQRQM